MIIGVVKMFDSHTTFIVATVERYLESIGFNTQIIGYGNIKKYPAKKASGVSFSLATKGNSAGIQYAILFYPTFAKTISAIHNTFETLLNQNSPRATTLKSVLKQDDEYLFVFALMHEFGHIQHIIELNIDDDMFFNSLSGFNSNPNNNFMYENYADQFSLKHSDEIYKLICSKDE
jgi:hypothetical protein